MDRLLVHPNYEKAWAALGLRSVAAAVAHFLPDYKQRRKVTVRRATVPDGGDGIDVYFKLYHHRPGGFRYWLRTSKARREFDNYLAFARLGVPAAEAIACGDDRDGLGRLRRAFILTRTVPNACGLDEFFWAKPAWEDRRKILRELADIVRRLHAAHFHYYDLVWRNILVNRDSTASSRLALIDCPRGDFGWFGRRRKVLRDLGSLDKSAAQFCTRTERLRFLLNYLGISRLEAEARALAQSGIQYRRSRWPEDWRGK